MLVKSAALKHVVHSRLGDKIGRGLCRGLELQIGEDQVGSLVAADAEGQQTRQDERKLDRRRARPVACEVGVQRRWTPADYHKNGSLRKMTVDTSFTVPVPGFEPPVVPPVQQEPPVKHAPIHGTINERL